MNDVRKTKAQMVSELAELRQRVADLETTAALHEAKSAGLVADRDLNDELLHLACDLAQVGGWEFDALTFKGTWTEEVARIHDLDPAQETNVELGISFYTAESRVKIDQAIKAAIEQAKPYDLELEMISAAGTPKWVRTIGLPTVKDGRVIRVRGIFQDITERKRARDALRASEEKYRTLFDNLTAGMALHQLVTNAQDEPVDYIILHVNPLYETLLGLKRDQVIGRLATAAYGVTEAPYLKVYARVVATGEPVRFETYFPPLDRYFEISVISTGPGQFATMFLDVSLQKRAQAQLNNLAKFPEENPYPVMRFRRDGQVLYANTAGQALLQAWGCTMGDYAPLFWRQVAADVHVNQSKRFIDVEQDDRVWSFFVTAVAGTDYVNLYGRDITERKRAEAALRESEARFRQAVLNAPVPMMIHDEDDQIYQLSQGWTRYSGYTLADIPTMGDWTERAYGQRSGFAKDYIDSLFQIDETVNNGEWVIHTRDGQYRTWDFYTTPLSHSGNGKRLLLSIAVDVTDRKRVETEIRALNAELEQRVADRTAELSDLYNNAPCGYHSLDAAGKVTRVNDTELSWLGYTREELLGRRFSDVLTPDSVRTFEENFPVFKERGWVHDLEFDLVRKDGSILPVLLSATLVRDVAGRYLVSRSTIVDHTERKRAEQAMRLSQTRLEAANKELEAFSYSISHDLRAPLRSLDGFSRILLEDHAPQLSADAQHYLHIVRKNSQIMGRLIDDLLAFSRLGRQPVRKQSVDLTALVRQTLAELIDEADGRSIQVVVADLPPCEADPALLKQVLVNLLSNAIKFTVKQPMARVEIGCTIEQHQPVYFIRDNGVGFDPQYVDKLFGVFQRLHRAEDYEGTGVGLAIVKRIIDRHGGWIKAEGAIEQGATFSFALGSAAGWSHTGHD